MNIPDTAKTWHTDTEKTSWGYGPWLDEPDKVSWSDSTTGRPCLIVRNQMGALCGYVAVDPGHPLHGSGYSGTWDDTEKNAMDRWVAEHGDIDVHGGLTYAAACQHDDDESTGICHVPEPGQPDDVWWFGFDCGHAGDLVPRMRAYGLGFGGDVYRPVSFVASQCELLATQLSSGGAS